ncbi:MAG: zf-HC2 domain-containing protein [Phycisphaerae bacterium]|jgi:anti-sigma factor RsiW|nr:zf-HC2 domain-containing protein [Phycisphaerae bacterium]HOO15749.1 zf-HC2 domain-containing protein [Phycisphaerae bacterium]HPC22157.1 zf-HC2 domain-containing protein [Phycisphaerae bacterium]HRS28477.1 zf-HC2 domain-containing protein [Phycisphaerae bacterium]HRT41244.1 zf-HC2 domain-containing protein [Phycisphaerae bacterium]
MTCQDAQKQLSAYHDGELDPARREDLVAHLQTCPACRAYLARLSLLNRVLQSGTPAEVPANLLPRVLGALASQRRRRRIREWGIRITAAAAGLALCVTAQRLLIVRPARPDAASAEASIAVELALRELQGAVAGAGLQDRELDALARRPEVVLFEELTGRLRP